MNEPTARHDGHKEHYAHEAKIIGIFVGLVCLVSLVDCP